MKPVLSDHVWALNKWSLNTGGLLIKGACIVWLSFGTSGSGRSRQVVTEYKWSQDRFHCIYNFFPRPITLLFLALTGYYNVLFLFLVAALGNTVQEIDVSKARGVFAKTIFSMVVPDVVKILEAESSRKSVVLFGIEVSPVCVCVCMCVCVCVCMCVCVCQHERNTCYGEL